MNLQETLGLIRRFSGEFLSPRVAQFEVSAPYALHPHDLPEWARDVEDRWPGYWPFHNAGADAQGVYLVLGRDFELLYVGKASMRSSIASRLSTYFGGGAGPCRVKHETTWTGRPEFVVVVRVPDELAFLAPALEEFLLREARPPDNDRGVPRGERSP